MFTKDEFKQALGEEIRLVRHLAGKLQGVDGSIRPGQGMRTLDELLGYLSVCGIAPADALVKDDWGVIPTWQERAKQVDRAGFDAAMGRQAEQLATLIDELSEADLARRQVGLPWGERMALGRALYTCPVRFLVAYRMQLFLYLKQGGHPELSTHNAWMGQDAPPAK